MKIVCIARWNDENGKCLAETLAAKLGYACYSREMLVEEATAAGIAVGKLETAVLKPGMFNERLRRERDRYIAFATARLCEKALESDVVYHGRTGHLLLPGVSHVLRVRVVEDVETRIADAMKRLNLPRAKAKHFVESVDDDIRKWVKNQYGADWASSAQYDVVVNLDQMAVHNAATALCSVATLPEFQDTPASRQALENLHLAARVRLALAENARTRDGHFHVVARQGEVVVTYQPQDMAVAESIASVAIAVDGVREVHATMAASNILWVEERFDPKSESCRQIIDLAHRWNAAVDLLQLRSGDGEGAEAAEGASRPAPTCADPTEDDGGIEDDEEEETVEEDPGLVAAHRELLREGVAGGYSVACGVSGPVSECVAPGVDYLLVVLGDLFLEKSKATRTRKTRELSGALHERVQAPVVTVEELKQSYAFGVNAFVKLAVFLALVVLVFALVFTHQGEVLTFLSAHSTQGKLLAAAAVFIVTPLFAFLYGSATKTLFKLIRME